MRYVTFCCRAGLLIGAGFWQVQVFDRCRFFFIVACLLTGRDFLTGVDVLAGSGLLTGEGFLTSAGVLTGPGVLTDAGILTDVEWTPWQVSRENLFSFYSKLLLKKLIIIKSTKYKYLKKPIGFQVKRVWMEIWCDAIYLNTKAI